MSKDSATVFISESISDRVDMDQFYDDLETVSVNVNIVSDGENISGRMTSFKLDKSCVNSFLHVSFVASADDIENMLFTSSIETLSFTTGLGDREIRSFSDASMISKKFDIDHTNNQCLCEFIFEMHNI
jgi:hypothetical protein